MDASRFSSRSLLGLSAVVALGALTVSLSACGSDEAGSGGSGAAGPGSGAAGPGGGGGQNPGGGGPGGSGAGDTLCPPEPSGSPPALKLTQIANGFEFPVLAVGAPGDTSRLYVIEQEGRVRIIKDGTTLPDPFLDISGVVQPRQFDGDERGLLGLAFHPDFAENGRFFLHYTDDADDHGHVVEFRRSADPDKAEPAATKDILQMTEKQVGNHNGGMIAFGADGFLYFGMGDGGGANDPDGNGQNLDTKLGKILRIDVDAYPTGVAGNLPGGNPHIWDYGLRNPFRFSFDRCTKDLYIGDVGQDEWEEIIVEPKGQGLKNYGWNVAEANHCFPPGAQCSMDGITPAVAEYPHSQGCSVAGGYVYRGSAIPNLVGTYFYGDYCSNRIWTLVWKDGALVSGPTDVSADLETSATLQAIASFGEDTAGEIYVVDLGGAIYRIDAE